MKNDPIYDEERIKAENLTELLYNYEDDGTYSHHVGYDYLKPEELLMHDMLRLMKEKLENIKLRVMKGELSPISYHMEKTNMEPGILSKFVGIPVRKVKKHLTPGGFQKLKTEELKKYAMAFEITLDELMTPGQEIY
jgi:hypothetical protein